MERSPAPRQQRQVKPHCAAVGPLCAAPSGTLHRGWLNGEQMERVLASVPLVRPLLNGPERDRRR